MLDVMSFYKNKRVFITGHTGFKGSWMCELLAMAGADVTGYALEPPEGPSLFDACRLSRRVRSVIGDVRDLRRMRQAFDEARPEIVIHMAAQPLVRESYRAPAYTFETNVMGTVNVLECVREAPSVRSVLNVTTDKVYLNREWEWGYREDDELNGLDPYSNSKSCSELVTGCYKNSFLNGADTAVSTARAGNVIGGGDFAACRVMPDCVRAAMAGRDIVLRNPHSVRPYQHVLDPVAAYLMIAGSQVGDAGCAGSYNVGPDEAGCLSTGELASCFCKKWNERTGGGVKWLSQADDGPHEAGFLKLDCSRLKKTFGWRPRWSAETAVEKVVEWTDVYARHGDVASCMRGQIEEFLAGA